MSSNSEIAKQLDSIDAAIFSGDAFFQIENRMLLREHLERWVKWDKDAGYFAADGMLLNSDGTRSIFDDVDQ